MKKLRIPEKELGKGSCFLKMVEIRTCHRLWGLCLESNSENLKVQVRGGSLKGGQRRVSHVRVGVQ